MNGAKERREREIDGGLQKFCKFDKVFAKVRKLR